MRSKQICRKAEKLGSDVSIMILTGDTSAGTLRSIAIQCCVKILRLSRRANGCERSEKLAALSPTPRPLHCRDRHFILPYPWLQGQLFRFTLAKRIMRSFRGLYATALKAISS